MTDASDTLRSALADRYVLERELGRGGMATVYLARDLRHDRAVALKAMHPELAAALGPERFLREVRLTARLDHPHILPVLDSGGAEGLLWYTMPYVEGESLRGRLRREVQLPVAEAVRLARELADALDYAHQQGIVHRDIKPENILLSRGHARVADFGIARAMQQAGGDKLTETGLAVGTPAYMSPEQASGGPVDGRSDIYSLGCVLYEMLAGEPPFTGPTAQAVFAKRLSAPLPRLGLVREAVSVGIEHVVTNALSREPADRFATAAEFAEALARAAVEPVQLRGVGHARLRWAWTLLSVAAAIGVLGSVYVLLRQAPAAPSAEGAGPRTAAAPAANAIAVLPLVNVGGDTANEYFADGMTDELASALGRVPGLRVAARTSSFAFKGRTPEPDEVGKRLRVGSFLAGSVRRSGRVLRVAAQLISTGDGLTLWSDTYQRELRTASDVFEVQDAIARAIVSALTPTLASHASQGLAIRGTEDIEAHDLYLKGRFFQSKYTEADLRRSLALYEQALKRDPDYALAWTGIADVWAVLADDWVAPLDAYPRAKAAVLKAIALDSTLPEAHFSLHYILLWLDGDVPAAERELQRAVALEAKPSELANESQFFLLIAKGQIDSAIAVRESAKSLDPLSPWPSTDLGLNLPGAGQPARAVQECRRALQLAPDFAFAYFCLGNALLATGRPAEALDVFERAPLVGPRARAGAARALVALGRRDEALRVLNELRRESAQRYVSPELIAGIYVSLGDRDAAFKWLERAREAKAPGLALFLRNDERWDPIRSDPRFAALTRRLLAS